MACRYIRYSRDTTEKMVSLSDDGRRSGGFFFDSANNADTDDLLTDNTSLGHQEEKPFRKIKTAPLILALIVLTVCQECAVFLLPYFCKIDKTGKNVCNLKISTYSALIYIHCGMWVVLLIFDRIFRWQHRISRSNGYLEFYRKTRHIRRLPIIINSGGNVMLLLLTVVLWDFCETDKYSNRSPQMRHEDMCNGIALSQTNYLQILFSLETAILIPILLVYLVRTVRFNRSSPAPDVQQDDAVSGFLHQSQSNTSEVGFRDETFMDDVLEKQADMIRYLKQHNAHLGKKILHLTAQLQQQQQA